MYYQVTGYRVCRARKLNISRNLLRRWKW